MKDETATALMIPAGTDIAALFAVENGIEGVVKTIAADVAKIYRDVSTKTGRDEITSTAYKITRSKTFIDKTGVALNEDHQKAINIVNAQRNFAKAELDRIRAEYRKPLDDWEAAEKTRVESLQERMKIFAPRLSINSASADLTAAIDEVQAVMIDRDWQEFEVLALDAKQERLDALRGFLAAAVMREKNEAELAVLRKEKAERDARDAAERAAREAQELADTNARLAAERAVEQERQQAAQAAADAQAREDQLRRDLEASEARVAQAAADAKAAAQKALDDAEAARVAKEAADRAEAERLAKEEADAADRAAMMVERRAAVSASIATALSAFKTTADMAEAMIDGLVKHVEVRL